MTIKTTISLLFLFIFASSYSQEPPAVLLNQKTFIKVKDGKLQRTSFYEIKINNKSGSKYDSIQIPYSKLVKVKNIKAKIKTVDGITVKELNKKDISSRHEISSISFYEDNYVNEFTLKHSEYPYILEYSYEEEEQEFLYIDYWVPVMDFKIPTFFASLIIDIPMDYEIFYRDQKTTKSYTEELPSGRRFIWEATYDTLVKDEIYAPPFLNECCFCFECRSKPCAKRRHQCVTSE